MYLNKQKGTELFKVNLVKITSDLLRRLRNSKMYATTIGHNQCSMIPLAKFFWQLILLYD
ncbi:hypothetical protein GCM10010995_14100 [Cysteiniphilum litorale]|uniref:Uncharacterized protein n=1 Tax=Cysteiniphilum litorale TaxID=2056700 RepID=A0A8J2Z4H4_9GAMM|nr:hypothetical protein GCM10010995_14100 [Cysteiniphilum litorale]